MSDNKHVFDSKVRDGIPGLLSGELCYVSNSSTSQILPQGINKWLSRKNPQKSSLSEKLKRIRDIKLHTVESNKHRLDFFEVVKQEGPLLCELTKQGVLSSSHQAVSNLARALKELDDRLLELSLKYALITDAEKKVAMDQLSSQAKSCLLEQQQQLVIQHLGLFSLHLEHETDGGIALKRLPHAHPQFQRCKRAATENIKKNVFNSTYYECVNVQEVYKIENKALLSLFQHQTNPESWKKGKDGHHGESKSPEELKVKGLFCRVPRECVERVVVFGAYDETSPPSCLAEIFKKNWLPFKSLNTSELSKSYPSSRGVGGGFAADLVNQGKSLLFPRSFSRHSTLVEDHSYLTKHPKLKSKPFENKLSESQTLSNQEILSNPNLKNEHTRAGSSSSSVSVVSEDGESVMFLALCRVLMGKVKVDGGDGSGGRFETSIDEGEIDALYSSKKEEYTLYRPQFVLPEFLIQFNYTPKVNNPTAGHEKNMKRNDINDMNRKLNTDVGESSTGGIINQPHVVSLEHPHLSLPRRFAYQDISQKLTKSGKENNSKHDFKKGDNFLSSPSRAIDVLQQDIQPSSPSTVGSTNGASYNGRRPKGVLLDKSASSIETHPQSENVIFYDGKLLSEREALLLIATLKAQNSVSPSSTNPSLIGAAESSIGTTAVGNTAINPKEVNERRLNGQLQRRSVGGAVEKSFELFWQSRDLIQRDELLSVKAKHGPLRTLTSNKLRKELQLDADNSVSSTGSVGHGGRRVVSNRYNSGVFRRDTAGEFVNNQETKYAAEGRKAFMLRYTKTNSSSAKATSQSQSQSAAAQESILDKTNKGEYAHNSSNHHHQESQGDAAAAASTHSKHSRISRLNSQRRRSGSNRHKHSDVRVYENHDE